MCDGQVVGVVCDGQVVGVVCDDTSAAIRAGRYHAKVLYIELLTIAGNY